MAVVIEQQQNGTGSGTSVTTSAALGVVAAHKYLVFVGSKVARTVTSVVGMGLTWTLVKAQCSGRSQSQITIFEGTGTPDPSPGTITANFVDSTISAVIVAYRLSGVNGVTPILVSEGSNTNGEDDPVSCTGGSDDSTPTLSLDVQKIGSLILGAIGRRQFNFTAGTGYVTETDIQADTGGDASSVSIESKTSTATGATTVDASLSGNADWSEVAIELDASAPTELGIGVDAILLATQTVTPTVDSIVSKTQTEAILADAQLQVTNTETPTVDSLLRKQQTNNVTVDALLRATQTETITTDALILQGTANLIAVDGLIQATQTETPTIDALLRAKQVNNVTNDSILVNRNTTLATIDALLLAVQTLTPTIDGIVVNRNTETTTNDAIVVNRPSVNPTVDSILKRIVVAQISVDGIPGLKPTATVTVDALKSFPFLEIKTVDAILAAISPSPLAISVDGIVDQAGQVQTFMDALLRGQETATVFVDGQVFVTQVCIEALDSILVNRFSASPLVDAKVVLRSPQDILVDSRIVNEITLPITVDSNIELLTQAQISVDATIEQAKISIASLIDSILVNRNTAQAIVDAHTLFIIQKPVSVDSNLRARIPLGISVDSAIRLLNIQESIQVDSLLAQGPTQFLTLNARLLGTQPLGISIDALIIRANQITLDAKLGTNQVGRIILIDSQLTIPRRIRSISEIRDNIFTTSIIRRQTRT